MDPFYSAIDTHPGFVWRIPDEAAARGLEALGHDSKISATVSVWDSVDDLRAYTFDTLYGEFLERTHEWFEEVECPQLVIWTVERDARPDFEEAFKRLVHLRRHGDSDHAYGWPKAT